MDSEGPSSLAGLRSLLNEASHLFKAFLSLICKHFYKESPVANRAVTRLTILTILIHLAGVRSTFVAACSTGNATAGSKGHRAPATCRIAVSVLSFAKHRPEGLNVPLRSFKIF